MRHKYDTPSLVLSRFPIGEASVSVMLLTPEVGFVRARAQSIRKPGAKLAPALQTFSESDVILVRGKDGWRLSGAILSRNWFSELSPTARDRAGRTIGLLLRLVHGESSDTSALLFSLLTQFFQVLLEYSASAEGDSLADAAECLAALRILRIVGVDAGVIPGGVEGDFSPVHLQTILDQRADVILRINRGIAASGL